VTVIALAALVIKANDANPIDNINGPVLEAMLSRWCEVSPLMLRLIDRGVKRVHDDIVILAELGVLERTQNGEVSCPYTSMHIDMYLPTPSAWQASPKKEYLKATPPVLLKPQPTLSDVFPQVPPTSADRR
jgi:hypothetical protein